jgi:TonB family protein
VKAAGARTATGKAGQRNRLMVALLASLLFHAGALLLAFRLPGAPRRPLQQPVSFTLVERPARKGPPPPPASIARPPPASGSAGSRLGPPSAEGVVGPGGATGVPVQPDAPFAVPSAPPGPSFQSMSQQAAEAVVQRRGPLHAPGNGVGERLAESLRRGAGAMAVTQHGFWDGYFGEVRKVLLWAWSAPHVRAHASRATCRVRLVIDAEGLLRDFDILIGSGDAVLDADVVRALHQTPRFPLPPGHVLQGNVELVTEWELTVHPGLAAAQGEVAYGGLTTGVVFDVVTLVNPGVDLKPLERNVALATYYTR